jgi:hypothetical protein
VHLCLCVCVCVCVCVRACVFSNLFRRASFQVCVAVCMRSALVWDFTQRWMVVCFRRFGATYQQHLQRPSCLLFKWKIFVFYVVLPWPLEIKQETLLTACRTLLGNMKTWISTLASAIVGPDIWIVSKYDSFSTHITFHEITAYYLRRFFYVTQN